MSTTRSPPQLDRSVPLAILYLIEMRGEEKHNRQETGKECRTKQ